MDSVEGSAQETTIQSIASGTTKMSVITRRHKKAEILACLEL